MRRFLLTVKSRFKGAIEAHYDVNGQLMKIDFSRCQAIEPDAIRWFKNAIAVRVENIEKPFEGTTVTLAEADFEVSFEDFKREYPYKRNTHLAAAYWPRLTSAQQYSAFLGAMEYRKYLERTTWQKPMIPDKWLKQEQFKNDWKAL